MNPDAPSSHSSVELRKLPSVSAVLTASQAHLFRDEADNFRVLVIRDALSEARARVLAGSPAPELPAILDLVRSKLARHENALVRRVINATGIALHTNLGRAPLPRDVMDRVTELTTSYCSLEMDLSTGQRGKRAEGIRQMLQAITRCDDAIVVNNGAAAVYLALATLAVGREVIISRGELVQIGGGFRVPDILATSGAKLREVGTTNITSLADYERAITPDTAMILRVHRSNFHISGHTEEPALADLAALAKSRGIPFVMDLGSGAFVRWQGYDPVHEPTVQDVLRAGVDLATFSGDKLVGGPQSGFVVGSSVLVRKLAKHPLYRALRVGRMTLVTVQEVLRYYVAGRHRELAPWSMLEQDEEALAARGDLLLVRLSQAGIVGQWLDVEGTVGGGAAPGAAFSTRVVALAPKDPSDFLARLRSCEPAVVPRIERDQVLIDLRTVLPEESEPLAQALLSSWRQ